MTQQTQLEAFKERPLERRAPDSLSVCPSCGKIVPPTQYCIVCGGPILAKRRYKEGGDGS